MYMGHWVKSENFQNLSIQTTKENIQNRNKKSKCSLSTMCSERQRFLPQGSQSHLLITCKLSVAVAVVKKNKKIHIKSNNP